MIELSWLHWNVRVKNLLCWRMILCIWWLGIVFPALLFAKDTTWTPDQVGYHQHAQPFFAKYCITCHAGDNAEGDFALDEEHLANRFTDLSSRSQWREIVNVLNSHEMPPEKERQPSSDEVARIVDWITQQTVQAELQLREQRVVLRRLNNQEYSNTIRDLLGVDFDSSGFPEDPAAGGFDNNGGALTLSPLHVEMYLAAAQQILDRALVEGERPASIKWRFEPRAGAMDRTRLRLDDNNNPIVNGNNNLQEGEWVVVHHNYWDKGVGARDFRVPVPGVYAIRVKTAGRTPTHDQVVASAEQFLAHRRDEQDQQNPAGKKYTQLQYQYDLDHFRQDRMYHYGPPRLKMVLQLGPLPRTVAEFDIEGTPDDPQIHEYRERFTTETAGVGFEYAYSIPRVVENQWMQTHDKFARPELMISWFEIEGPLDDAWPPSSHTRIFFSSPQQKNNEPKYVREVLARFMKRAYRRPVEADEVEDKWKLYQAARSQMSMVEAVKRPLLAVLTSPNFLYLVEAGSAEVGISAASQEQSAPTEDARVASSKKTAVTDSASKTDNRLQNLASKRAPSATRSRQGVAQKVPTTGQKSKNKVIRQPGIASDKAQDTPAQINKLSDFEYASRLSYFLWSSMPDDELIQLAESGELRQPETVIGQVDRMLADPRSEAFVKNFAGQWLGLRSVGTNPPAEDLYPQYDRHLETSMVRESEAYFAEFLRQDLDARQMLKSDFVVINERLARFYGIPGVRGDEFRRVAVPAGVHRGGIVTQASILTITSNGTRTSPVKRGTWVLKTLLGTDPGLPVANAGEIAPKVPGIDKATVRKRLEIHRELPQCARCHSKIDPLGFAMENFNAAGEWRDQEGFGYKGRVQQDDPSIDASSQMPDGRKIQGVEGLQAAMLDQDHLFLNALTTKLMTYACGREMGLADQPEIKAAITEMQAHGHSLRSLVKFIASCDTFNRH